MSTHPDVDANQAINPPTVDHIPPTQYDTLATTYGNLFTLPVYAPEIPSVEAVLGNITGYHCLDLACGLGRWTHFLLSKGAASVTAVDISAPMISELNHQAHTSWPEEFRDKLTTHVADCSKPFTHPDLQGKHFDLVLGAWLLNYAACPSEQAGMWRTIASALEPGGRFIGLTPNVHVDLAASPIDGRYGIEVLPVERIERGWKARLVARSEPVVEFETYHLEKSVYEDGAREAGMVGLRWEGCVVPVDGWEEGYWDAFLRRPALEICTAWKG